MKRRHRIVSCFICLALILGAFSVWWFARRERPLLEIATVVDIPTTGVLTTVTVPFPEIVNNTHSGAVLSPDGKWVMWHDDAGVNSGEIATGKKISWVAAGDAMHLQNYWLPDSRHWLQFTTAPDYVTLHCVDTPEQSVRMTFPKSGPNDTRFHYSDAFVTTTDHIIVTLGQFDVTGMRPGVTITEYGMQPQTKRVVLTARHFIPASKEFALRRSAISPDGSHVAWTLVDSTEDRFTRVMRRRLPKLVQAQRFRVKLCTSRLDGGAWSEIGVFDTGKSADDVGVPTDLIWLPDGKRISFRFMDRVFTVPVN